MQFAVVAFSILVLIGLGIQSYQSLHLARLFRKYRTQPVDDNKLPNCAVVLSLRGCDPGIAKRIEMLIGQDYPCFHIYILFDSELDPAYSVVNRIIDRLDPPNVSVRVIEKHISTCSLVANNLAAVLPELAQNHEVIVLVDADAEPWDQWLRTLVTPLVISDNSVVYGNRWYMPSQSNFASVARFIWNFGSVQQMVFFKYPWAGSLAMKSEFVNRTDFVEVLKKSITNDTQIYSLAKTADMQVAFHPGIMLINRETIRLRNFYFWMSRQLVYGRLYHPSWPLVIGNGVLTGLVIGLAIVLNIWAIANSDWFAFMTLTATMVFYWIVWVGFLMHLDRVVTQMKQGVDQAQQWWSVVDLVKIFFVAPAVQFLFLGGLFRATFMRRTMWREIEYEINGPFEIKMVEYRPFQGSGAVDESIL